jgi:hypothetical protein
VIDLLDRLRTLHGDRKHFAFSLGFDPHYFTLTYKPNRTTKLATIHGHSETYWSMLRNHGSGLQQQATDADILRDRFELDYQVNMANLQANRILQLEAPILALLRRGGRPRNAVEFAHSVRLLWRPEPDANCGYAGVKRARRMLPKRPVPAAPWFNPSAEIRWIEYLVLD